MPIRESVVFFSVVVCVVLPHLVGCETEETPTASESPDASAAATDSNGASEQVQDDPRSRAGSDEDPTPKASSRSDEAIRQGQSLLVGFATSMRMQFALGPEIGRIERGEIDPEHLAVIQEVLRHTNEVFVHRMRGEDENTVISFSDGREGVYGADDLLVENGYNDGTFNYFDAETEPLKRFVADTAPWIAWGLNENDPTFLTERTRGFVSDLEGGVVRARQAWQGGSPPPSPKVSPGEFGRVEALALFIRVVESEGAEALYGLVTGPSEPTDDILIDTLTRIDAGLVRLFAEFEGVMNPSGRREP